MYKSNSQLKAQITQLKKQNEQFRCLTHELIEVFYKSVNKSSQKTSNWTFNPDLEPLLKVLSNLKNKPKTNQAQECIFNFMKDFCFRSKVKKEAHD